MKRYDEPCPAGHFLPYRTENQNERHTSMDKFLMRFLMSFILLSALTGFADGEAGNTKKKNARNNPLLLEYPVLYVARPQYNYDHHNTETPLQTAELNTKLLTGNTSLRL
jgi:hypothetical protein